MPSNSLIIRLLLHSELILRRIDSSRELKIILKEGWIIEDHGNVTEELRIVKLPRGGIVFEGTEKITSIPIWRSNSSTTWQRRKIPHNFFNACVENPTVWSME